MKKKLNASGFITSAIDPEEYVLMHKDALNSILVNSNVLGIGYEIFEKFGLLAIGSALTLLKIPGSTTSEYYVTLAIGIYSAGYAWYFRWQKHKLIQQMIKDKMNN